MPGIYPESCRYCGSPVVLVTSATTTEYIPLEPDPVPSATVAPGVGYALSDRSTARLVSDLHLPPESCYRRHRCPQFRDAAARQEAEQLSVGAALDWWQDQIDAHVLPAAPEIPDEIRRLA